MTMAYEKKPEGIRKVLADRRGLAATEAAFLMPIFLFAALAVFDLGRGGASRMDLDQALRAGAQVSMINITEEAEVVNAVLAALNEAASGSYLGDGLCAPDATCVSAVFQCECVAGVATTCASICGATGEPPAAYLRITAARRQEGVLFPDHGVETSIMVQTR
jgi:Flp pilus assembly protein TadG